MIFHFAHLNSCAGLISSSLFSENQDFKTNCLGSCSLPFAFDAFQNVTGHSKNSALSSNLLSNISKPTTSNQQSSSGSLSNENKQDSTSSKTGNNSNSTDNNGNTAGNGGGTGYISNTCLECNSLNVESEKSNVSNNNLPPSKI